MRRWKAHRGKIASLSFSRDGQFLASMTHNSRDVGVSIWNAADGRLERTLASDDPAAIPPRSATTFASFSPDEPLLALVRREHLEIWDTGCWACLAECVLKDSPAPADELAISCGERPLIARSVCGQVDIWEASVGEAEFRSVMPVTQWQLRDTPKLSFSSNGSLLATHGKDQVVVRNPETGAKLASLTHEWSVFAGPIRFSPDSARLTFGFGKAVESHPATLDNPDAVIRYVGHTDKVHALRCTPDGRTLISASSDGTVRMWEASTGLEKRCFDMKIGKIAAADVSPDGAVAAVGGANGEIVVWDLE